MITLQQIDLAQTIDQQNEIIKMQSDIIDKLFLQLLQYCTVKDMDSCGIVSDIAKVEKINN